MPEILIAQVAPRIGSRDKERILSVTSIGALPDRTSPKDQPYRLNNGTSIGIDLSGVAYRPSNTVRRITRNLLDYGEVLHQYEDSRTIPKRHWLVVLESEILKGVPRLDERDQDRAEILTSRRSIELNNEGVGSQTLSPVQKLIIRLWQPIVSLHQTPDGRWVQRHNYPDYPAMSVIAEEAENNAWIRNLSRQQIRDLRESLGNMQGEIGSMLRQRYKAILKQDSLDEAKYWRENHPGGNWI